MVFMAGTVSRAAAEMVLNQAVTRIEAASQSGWSEVPVQAARWDLAGAAWAERPEWRHAHSSPFSPRPSPRSFMSGSSCSRACSSSGRPSFGGSGWAHRRTPPSSARWPSTRGSTTCSLPPGSSSASSWSGSGEVAAGRAIVLFACACMVGAGIVLVATSRRFLTAAALQAGPPLLAIVAALLL